MRKLLVTLVMSLVCCVADTYVSAAPQTANDLLEKYNRKVAVEMQAILKEYKEKENTYNDLKHEAEKVESFNALYDMAYQEQEERRVSIEEQVDEVMRKNKKISKSIKDNIEVEDFDVLLALDSEYRANVDRINSLLSEENSLVLTERPEFDYSQIVDIENEMKYLEKEYEVEESNYSLLGAVDSLRYPLNGTTYITSSFGYRLDPVTKASKKFHAGIDLKAMKGTEVLSLFNGKIADTGYSLYGGNYVKVDHGDGIMTLYYHLSEVRCEKGQIVNQYDVIALSGSTGLRTTGPHLHLGLYIDGNPVDPEILFDGVG